MSNIVQATRDRGCFANDRLVNTAQSLLQVMNTVCWKILNTSWRQWHIFGSLTSTCCLSIGLQAVTGCSYFCIILSSLLFTTLQTSKFIWHIVFVGGWLYVLEQTRDSLCIVARLPAIVSDLKEACHSLITIKFYDILCGISCPGTQCLSVPHWCLCVAALQTLDNRQSQASSMLVS